MKKILVPVTVLLTAAILFYTLRFYKIDGTSMNYSLVEGDFVLTYRLFHTIKRGDILVIKHPLDPKGRLYIKRCAALPGDRFFQKKRSFYLQIDGNSDKTKALGLSHDLEVVQTKEGYFLKDPYEKYYDVVHNWRLIVPSVLTKLPVTTVQDDHYYMLGDYRDNSADSRFFGAVPRNWIYSKVICILKKPRDWETLINIEEADKKK
ncbi:Signal peptidase I [hydrothermal vent metagenome]|uniref:Signal peptidase I n=1 Tax=hydrothermal vent metagenome TaxID=652676 RepID=A0A1W1BG26_9ZZZZ